MRVGIVGLDSFFFSQMFTSSLQSIQGVEVVGCTTLGVAETDIVNNNGLTAQEFSAKFQIPVYEQLDELLEKERVEAVCLATRPSVMPQILKRLVEQGIHVYVAKPVAVDEAGLLELKSIKANNAIVSAGPTARFDPIIRQAQERTFKQEVGTPTAIRVLHQHGMLKFWPQESWYYQKEEGGIEHFLAWYCLDLLRWYSGQEITFIQGVAANTIDHGSPHADVLKGICKLAEGAIGSFDVLFNVSYPYPSFEIEVIGTTGAIKVQQDQYDGHVFTKEGKSSFGRLSQDSLVPELQDWVKACKGEQQTSLQLDDIIQLVQASLSLKKNLLL